MINYKWTISALDCNVDEEGLKNVVKTIHWRYRGTDEDGTTAEVYGAESVPSPNPEEFKEFETLNQEVVEGWLESILDVDEKKQNIQQQIEEIKNPVKVTLPLPNTDTTGSQEETPTASSN